ncbi:hypothetical protein SEA_POKYPUPPY_93 [Gordonia phage PokyPuppy]|nr:hypothetical protein SEA_POKYPUPPY_93 [Gordonia phage PokyPuppy]
MGKHNRPDDTTTTDRCTPAGTEPDALAVRVSPAWRGEATSLLSADSSTLRSFEVGKHAYYREAKRALHDVLMTELGDNVSLKLVLEDTSFSEFYVTDHNGQTLGSAVIRRVGEA